MGDVIRVIFEQLRANAQNVNWLAVLIDANFWQGINLILATIRKHSAPPAPPPAFGVHVQKAAALTTKKRKR